MTFDRINFSTLLDICTRVLDGLTRFAKNTFEWMFNEQNFVFTGMQFILDLIGVDTLTITPFEFLIDTFFVFAVIRIVLNING